MNDPDLTPPVPRNGRPRVVIIGGGFGGLEAARALEHEPVEVVLIDKRNHHLFQPLLYQVATAGLSAPDIAAPIRKLLAKQANARVLLAEVEHIDVPERTLRTNAGPVPWDVLIVAVGMSNSYFGNDHWEQHAPGLKSLHDALTIRKRVLLAFELAELCDDEEERRALLTFCVVGGGPTGVELAGALSEIARHTLAKDFRSFDPAEARVVLVEGMDRILLGFDEHLARHARERLEEIGVEVHLGDMVADIDEDGVHFDNDSIASRTVLWAAGVGGRGMVRSIGGATIDRAGRLHVDADLRVSGVDAPIFAVGDIARFEGDDGAPLPGVAQVALQQGRQAAKNAMCVLREHDPSPFSYRDLGSLATIGRSAAIAELGRFRFTGLFAWLIWTFVHIMALVGFRNRVAVLIDWASAYMFWSRGARIVMEEPIGDRGRDEPPSEAAA